MPIYNSVADQKAEQALKWLRQLHNQFQGEIDYLKDGNKPYAPEQMFAQRRAFVGRIATAEGMLAMHLDWIKLNAPEWEARLNDAITSMKAILAVYDAWLSQKVPTGQTYLEALQAPVAQTVRDSLAGAIKAELE